MFLSRKYEFLHAYTMKVYHLKPVFDIKDYNSTPSIKTVGYIFKPIKICMLYFLTRYIDGLKQEKSR